MESLVVFSHLRWDFVYQRPQHLLSRLAGRYCVTYIEEPRCEPSQEPHLQMRMPEDRLTIVTPVTKCSAPGYDEQQLPIIRPLIRRYLRETHSFGGVAWFYTPMALPLIYDMSPKLTIYDCMDELSKFRFAPAELVLRERELLELADVVFTGGPSLYRHKKSLHPNVHCFPSSVDAGHFGRACSGLAEPEDMRGLPHPRIGFFGVVDERFDLELLDFAAKAHPDWQFVIIGPVVKIDPDSLPRHENIHYLGQREYKTLPQYLSGWDVCILPFARNESTEFISPTKTLEYMAAERPIVSTPITDVAEPYGDIVYLGATPGEFVRSCEQALQEHPAERMRRIEGMRHVLAGTSWDKTVRSMDHEIRTMLKKRRATINALALGGTSRNRATGAV